MKRLNYTKENWEKVIAGTKTATRRCHDKPRYSVGDVVVLTEPTQIVEFDVPYGFCLLYPWDNKRVWFHESEITNAEYFKINKWKNAYKQQPAMFMLESFARHFVRISEVRQEPLQDISDEDCIAEGIQILPYPAVNEYPRVAFESLWDSINGKKPGRRWADNPMVFAYGQEYLEGFKP